MVRGVAIIWNANVVEAQHAGATPPRLSYGMVLILILSFELLKEVFT